MLLGYERDQLLSRYFWISFLIRAFLTLTRIIAKQFWDLIVTACDIVSFHIECLFRYNLSLIILVWWTCFSPKWNDSKMITANFCTSVCTRVLLGHVQKLLATCALFWYKDQVWESYCKDRMVTRQSYCNGNQYSDKITSSYLDDPGNMMASNEYTVKQFFNQILIMKKEKKRLWNRPLVINVYS